MDAMRDTIRDTMRDATRNTMSDTMKDTIRDTMKDDEGCKKGYTEICIWKYMRDLDECSGGNNRDTMRSIVTLGGQK
ncbi:hypothetical protein PoB_002327400, partial [Plakobranchus ocellatus]